MKIKELYNKYGSADIYDKNIKYKGYYIKNLYKDDNGLIHIIKTSKSYEDFNNTLDEWVRKDVYEGVKTYSYQILCHSSSNGLTPFVSNNLCLREAETQQELEDMALVIEHILKRRIKGIQDPDGHYISPLFPKLLYWTCDGLNVKPGDPYYYLTELAVECEIKRTQPDIVSEKETRRVKQGQIIPSMGCRSLLAPIWEDRKYPVTEEFYYVEGVGTYPYGTFVDKKSFELFENRAYKTGYDEGEVSINFRGNTGWLKEKTDEYVIIEQPMVYGRFNQGVVSVNLPYIALEAVEIFNNEHPDIEKWSDVYMYGVKREFYKNLDKKLEVVKTALEIRHQSVASIKGKNSAILWQYGGLSRIGADDTVGDLMKDHPKRASISVGYMGLYETCRALIDQSNTTEDGQKLSIEILEHMNNVCNNWKIEGYYEGDVIIYDNDDMFTYNGNAQTTAKMLWDLYEGSSVILNNKMYTNDKIYIKNKLVWYIEKYTDDIDINADISEENIKYKVVLVKHERDLEHLNYSIYGTPAESLTGKFANAIKKRFGVIPYITDKDYVVNSYHVDPRENIDAFTKLQIEGQYLALSSGGAVSYVETLDLVKNPAVILDIIQWMHENIIYAEFNRKIGVCYECGYEGDIDLVKTEDGEFKFICPCCGNTDDNKMSVTGRICGYLGKINAGNTGKGRLDDIYNRTIHLDCHDEHAF